MTTLVTENEKICQHESCDNNAQFKLTYDGVAGDPEETAMVCKEHYDATDDSGLAYYKTPAKRVEIVA